MNNSGSRCDTSAMLTLQGVVSFSGSSANLNDEAATISRDARLGSGKSLSTFVSQPSLINRERPHLPVVETFRVIYLRFLESLLIAEDPNQCEGTILVRLVSIPTAGAMMAPREDIVTSAVSFLQDPSVASSPVEKRVEFLRSKNLTEEEVQISLARAENALPVPQPPPSQYYPPQQQYGRPPPQAFGHNYNPYGDFHAAAPEPPKRDWRDWFIMATVVGGVSYGLYVLADRYVKPLIAPPTPPQLEQDKAAIDEQFNRAFALIDTLASDTTALKEAEEARTKKLDTVLADVESVVADLKMANTRREDDARRMAEDITRLKDSLPNALDGVKQASERQLKELSTELTSLKTLMGNRLASPSSPAPYLPTGSSRSASQQPSIAPEPTPGSSSIVTGASPATTIPAYGHTASSAARPVPTTSRSSQFASTSSYGAGSAASGKAAIPAWQMAAQKKATEATPPATNGNVSGDSTGPATDGQDAVAALNAS